MRLPETNKLLIMSNTKNMKNKPYYTNETLVQLFNECDLIKRDQIIPLVEDVFNSQDYHEISDKIHEFCEQFWPEPKNYDSPEWHIWSNYFYGDYKDGKYEKPLGDWISQCEVEYIYRNGKKRTYKEACKLATDKWCELLFGWHLQDNGAINEDHPGGFQACALATVLGNDAKEKISEECKVKAHELIQTFYEDDCWWEYYNDDGTYYDTWQTDLTVDYGPCTALYKLLEKAGIEEKYIRSICPWKTSIKIDERDNSVIYRTYGKKEVL